MTDQSAQLRPTVDVARVAALAAEYDALQGLVWTVWGAGVLMAVITGEALTWLSLGGLLTLLVPRWYRRRYGLVRPTTARQAWVVLGMLAAAGLVLLAHQADRALQLPLLASVCTVAAVLCLGQFLLLRRTGLTAGHWVVYALVAAAAAGPLLGLGLAGDLDAYLMAVTGSALIVLGLIDHQRLARVLGPVADER